MPDYSQGSGFEGDRTFNPDDFFFTPAELGTMSLEYQDWLRSTPGIPYGIESVDADGFLPLRPGEVMGEISRPGHGKTTKLVRWAKHAQGFLKPDEVVLYVTFEQTVEEIEVMLMAGPGQSVTSLIQGRGNRDEMVLRALARPTQPVWMIGRSSLRKRKVPHLTAARLYAAIKAMEGRYRVKPRVICLDYIQIMPVERRADRQAQVTEAIVDSKALAQEVGATLIFGVQAGRGVDQRDDQLPTLADCQHASALEQVADRLVANWRPILSFGKDSGKTIKYKGVKYDITPDLLVQQLLKQRFAEAGQKHLLRFRPQFIELEDRQAVAGQPAPEAGPTREAEVTDDGHADFN